MARGREGRSGTFTDYGQDVVNGVGDASLHGAVYRGLLLNYFARLLTSPLKFKDQVVALIISDDWGHLRVQRGAVFRRKEEAPRARAKGSIGARARLTGFRIRSARVGARVAPRTGLPAFFSAPPCGALPAIEVQERQFKWGASVGG